MSDLFAPHQIGTIERIADERIAARFAQVFTGVNERFAEAVATGVKQALAGEVVSVPVFHLEDIARIEARYHAR